MKTNSKFKSCFLMAVMLVFAVCLSLPIFNTTKIFAVDSSPAIYLKGEAGNSSYKSYPFPTSDTAITVKLAIKNFAFEVGDEVKYYFTKDDTTTCACTQIGKVVITADNLTTDAELEYNPFSDTGAGVYYVKSSIVRNGNLLAIPSGFTIDIAYPSNLVLKISYEKLSESKNELGTYVFKVKLYSTNKELSLSGYSIKWYQIGDDNGSKVFANRSTFEWEPTETGNYNLSVVANSGTEIIESQIESITIVRDNSNIVIMCLCGVALLATIFVITTTVIRTKKERVW